MPDLVPMFVLEPRPVTWHSMSLRPVMLGNMAEARRSLLPPYFISVVFSKVSRLTNTFPTSPLGRFHNVRNLQVRLRIDSKSISNPLRIDSMVRSHVKGYGISPIASCCSDTPTKRTGPKEAINQGLCKPVTCSLSSADSGHPDLGLDPRRPDNPRDMRTRLDPSSGLSPPYLTATQGQGTLHGCRDQREATPRLRQQQDSGVISPCCLGSFCRGGLRWWQSRQWQAICLLTVV
ncbi:hypothetical protein ElyMa_000280300 [Elysia marginata]|uniref:Uncharacterized protein n=1 Tax=Elysia marginata TaxID=1093978 RepID=A0AAV4F844_9GAST|nr:hypothetical protein ElyMa_000280300 [Elysia marginata]